MKFTLLLLLGSALLPVAAAPLPLSFTVHHYRCQGGQTLDVTYLQAGRGMKTTSFALIDDRGQRYGLAQAPSASGARYASLYGPVSAHALGNGLEWWEHQGEGTLSAFTGKDGWTTTPLLKGCRTTR